MRIEQRRLDKELWQERETVAKKAFRYEMRRMVRALTQGDRDEKQRQEEGKRKAAAEAERLQAKYRAEVCLKKWRFEFVKVDGYSPGEIQRREQWVPADKDGWEKSTEGVWQPVSEGMGKCVRPECVVVVRVVARGNGWRLCGDVLQRDLVF